MLHREKVGIGVFSYYQPGTLGLPYGLKQVALHLKMIIGFLWENANFKKFKIETVRKTFFWWISCSSVQVGLICLTNGHIFEFFQNVNLIFSGKFKMK